MHKGTIIFVCIYVLAMSSACSQDKENTDRMLAKRSANDTYTLEKIAEIVLEENEKQYIGVVTSIQIAPNGDIYLNDERVGTVHVYTSQGKFIRRIGHMGQGPGEFQYNRLIRLSKNRLGVVDIGLRRISFFDLTGNYLESLSLNEEPGQLSIAGYFDYTPDGDGLYLEGISTTKEGKALCEESFTFIEYNRRLMPISRSGEFDPFTQNYCEQIPKKTIVRTDKLGNIYTVHTMVPRISKYSPSFRRLNMFNFYTDNWILPFDDAKPFDYTKSNVNHSRVMEMEVDKKTDRIFVYHGWIDYKRTTKGNKAINAFLTVLAPDGKILLTGKSMPLSPMDIDDEGYIYYLKSDTPDYHVLMKSRLKKITGD